MTASSAVAHRILVPPQRLCGILSRPAEPAALVIFVHGSGSGRLSPRNQSVAESFAAAGMATLLFDLLTEEEALDRDNIFDIVLLAERVADAVDWADADESLRPLPIGLFGASTGGAAALVAAARLGERIGAVVSRGGRPDLAGAALEQVRCPTLLIVGGADTAVLALNEQALSRLAGPKALKIVPGATHLFPEPGAMEMVADLAVDWSRRHLAGAGPARPLQQTGTQS